MCIKAMMESGEENAKVRLARISHEGIKESG